MGQKDVCANKNLKFDFLIWILNFSLFKFFGVRVVFLYIYLWSYIYGFREYRH